MAHPSDRHFSRGDLMRRITELEDRIKSLETARRLEAASIGAGGLTIAEDGSIQSDDFAPGEDGWRISEGGAEFNVLTLRDRLIGQEALAEPVGFDGAGATSGGDDVTGGDFVTKVAVEINLPTWADQVIILGVGNAEARNNSDTDAFLQSRVTINDIGGSANTSMLVAGNGAWSGTVFASAQRVIDDPQSPIPVETRARVDRDATFSDTLNEFDIDCIAIYRRVP